MFAGLVQNDECCGRSNVPQHSLYVIMHDPTGVEELNAAQERLDPNFGDRFIDLDRNKTGKESPVHKRAGA